MEIRKTSKRKTYSAVEKALLSEKYKTSGAKKTQWCAENVIGLSTLERCLKQEKNKLSYSLNKIGFPLK